MEIKTPIEISARHIHISQKDLEALFGESHQLHQIKQLSQPEEFAAEEVLSIEANGKNFADVRIVGPIREETQVEISKTDAVFLGANPPVKLSGDLENSLPVKIIGPNGEIDLDRGLIIAMRHIHCATDEAVNLNLKNGDIVSVKIEGGRGLVFDNVVVRVNDNYKLAMHIDTDEGNAAGINKIGEGTIIK